MQAYLFINKTETSKEEICKLQEICKQPVQIVDFFLSEVDNLLLCSRYRIISLPTFIIAEGKKVKFRLHSIPDSTLKEQIDKAYEI